MTRLPLQLKARLGLLVIATWILWPLVGFVLDYLVHFSMSTSRGCSIEGCTFDFGILDTLLVFAPPAGITILWWRRRKRPSSQSLKEEVR